jgi:hypothetical protein
LTGASVTGTNSGSETFPGVVAMWLKQLILFTFNICGSVLLLFMLASIGLLLMMLAVLSHFQ